MLNNLRYFSAILIFITLSSAVPVKVAANFEALSSHQHILKHKRDIPDDLPCGCKSEPKKNSDEIRDTHDEYLNYILIKNRFRRSLNEVESIEQNDVVDLNENIHKNQSNNMKNSSEELEMEYDNVITIRKRNANNSSEEKGKNSNDGHKTKKSKPNTTNETNSSEEKSNKGVDREIHKKREVNGSSKEYSSEERSKKEKGEKDSCAKKLSGNTDVKEKASELGNAVSASEEHSTDEESFKVSNKKSKKKVITYSSTEEKTIDKNNEADAETDIIRIFKTNNIKGEDSIEENDSSKGKSDENENINSISEEISSEEIVRTAFDDEARNEKTNIARDVRKKRKIASTSEESSSEERGKPGKRGKRHINKRSLESSEDSDDSSLSSDSSSEEQLLKKIIRLNKHSNGNKIENTIEMKLPRANISLDPSERESNLLPYFRILELKEWESHSKEAINKQDRSKRFSENSNETKKIADTVKSKTEPSEVITPIL